MRNRHGRPGDGHGSKGGAIPLLRAVLLTGILLIPPSVRAQGQAPAAESTLQDHALRFAQAWVNSEVERLEGMMEPSGVRLQLNDGQDLFVTAPQAGAAITSFMRRYAGGEAELFRVSQMGGDPASGFAEFQWTCGVSGLRTPVIFTLFVAFIRADPGWTVTEIRVLS